MGIKGRKLRAAKRKAEKRAAKNQRRAQYEAYAKIGKERKRQHSSVGGGEHKNCGNPACKKCFPALHERMRLSV